MFSRLSALSIRTRLALIIAATTALLLTGFTVFLISYVKQMNAERETQALQETNKTLVNMVAQTNEIMKIQAKQWGATFQSRFRAAFSLSEQGDAPTLRVGDVVLNQRFEEVDAFTRDSKGKRRDDFLPARATISYASPPPSRRTMATARPARCSARPIRPTNWYAPAKTTTGLQPYSVGHT
jgi:hypothetical protein